MAPATVTLLWIIRSTASADVSNVNTPGRVHAGAVIHPPGSTLGPRVQGGYLLVFLHSGGLTIDVDGQARHLGPGEVALLIPGHREYWQFTHDTESRQSWFNLPHPPLAPETLAALHAAPCSLPISAAMTRLLDGAELLRDGLTAPHAALLALVTAALVLYVEEARARGLVGEAARGHPAVAAAREVIRRRLHERIRLRQLAAAGHVAPEYLVHLFRKELGTTPIRYLWTERIRYGVYLLEHTGLSVADVATQAGFQTSYHFSRLVRAATGVPPRDLRRRSWGQS